MTLPSQDPKKGFWNNFDPVVLGDAKIHEEKMKLDILLLANCLINFPKLARPNATLIWRSLTNEILLMRAKLNTIFQMLFVFNSGYFKNSWRLKTATSIGIKTNEHLRNNHAVVENFNVQFNAKRERISLHFVYSVHFSHFHKYFQNPLRACQKMYLNLDNV